MARAIQVTERRCSLSTGAANANGWVLRQPPATCLEVFHILQKDVAGRGFHVRKGLGEVQKRPRPGILSPAPREVSPGFSSDAQAKGYTLPRRRA